MRTIRVTGKGRLKVHPDMTRIVITLEGRYMDYSETLKRSAEYTEQLKDTLLPFGIERTGLKTLSFNVDTEYESYKVKDEYKRRFAGYRFTHTLKLEFDSDNKRLGRILYALANCQLRPGFRLSYTVRDQEAVKNRLLGNAVRDAIAKAEVLSAAAGLKLGEIQDMDYSWGRIDLEVAAMRENTVMDPCMAPDGAFDINIEPDDIDVQDTVTMVWEIA